MGAIFYSMYIGERYLLSVYKGTDSIYCKPLVDSTVTLSLLQPGNYGMRIITDDNGNGRWDTGDLFAKKQPEIVVPYYSTIAVKAGWEHEVDFLLPEKQAKPSPVGKDTDSNADPDILSEEE